MATYARPGEQRTFILRDLSVGGVAVTSATVGATVMIGLYTLTGIEVVPPVTATVSGDDWSADLTMPVVVGTYLVTAIATVGFVFNSFSEEVVVVGSPPPGATTRAELRKRISMRLNDYKPLIITGVSTATTLIDNLNLRGDGGFYAGREAVGVGGTIANLYEVRPVIGSSESPPAITVDPGLPATPAIGDRFDLFNHRGVGWSVLEYNIAINNAIMNIGESAMERVTAEVEIIGGFAVIPNDWVEISSVDLKPVDSYGHDMSYSSISPSPGAGNAGFRVVPGSRTVEVLSWMAGYGSAITGAVRIHGSRLPSRLESDHEYTSVEEGWLVPQASSELLLMGAMRDPQSRRDALYTVLKREADQMRDLAFRMTGTNSVRIN